MDELLLLLASAPGLHSAACLPQRAPPFTLHSCHTHATAGLARCFSMKVGILPESILPKMLVDRLVQRGAVLQVRGASQRVDCRRWLVAALQAARQACRQAC